MVVVLRSHCPAVRGIVAVDLRREIFELNFSIVSCIDHEGVGGASDCWVSFYRVLFIFHHGEHALCTCLKRFVDITIV